MERKAPQEKKRMSYLKDRRNSYGENDKSSRKSIRRNKRAPKSADRRGRYLVLSALIGLRTADGDAVEQRLSTRRPKSWRKSPDAPLGQVVIGDLERRIRAGIEDGAQADGRIREVRRRLGHPS
ncbi:hypothetical protein ACWDYJ_12125 [Streptomyces sp. NPDC003042]